MLAKPDQMQSTQKGRANLRWERTRADGKNTPNRKGPDHTNNVGQISNSLSLSLSLSGKATETATQQDQVQ